MNGIQLHYVIGGHGDPVVLLHGWPETWYKWHKVMPDGAEQYVIVHWSDQLVAITNRVQERDRTNNIVDIYQQVMLYYVPDTYAINF